MARCVRQPSKGKELFDRLNSEFGYDVAKNCFLLANNDRFKSDYARQLKLDGEGVPTYQSLMNVNEFTDMIGYSAVISARQKIYSYKKADKQTAKEMLSEAETFNGKAENSKIIAYVESKDGKMRVKVDRRDSETSRVYAAQKGSPILADAIRKELSAAGIYVGDLTDEEAEAGISGVTDFSRLSKVAEGAVEAIRLAKGKKGESALTEEFCHLVVASNTDNPLVSRALSSLSNNEDAMRRVLGDDYDKYSELYSGNTEMLAEEALGKMLDDRLNGRDDGRSMSLFDRVFNWFKRLLSGLNDTNIQKAIDEATKGVSFLSDRFESGDSVIDRKKLSKSRRDKMLYNIDELKEKGLEILKESAETEKRRAYITKSFTHAEGNERAERILEEIKDDKDFVESLFYYASQCAGDIHKAVELLEKKTNDDGDVLTLSEMASNIRDAKHYIESYDAYFIGELFKLCKQASADEDRDKVLDKTFRYEPDGIDITLEEMYSLLNKLMTDARNRLYDEMKNLAVDTMSPLLGGEKGIMAKDLKTGEYKMMTTEELIMAPAKDISFTERWLDTMADSANPLAQALNQVVNDKQMKAHDMSVNVTRHVFKVMDMAKSFGIKDFSWMFEHYDDGGKTGFILRKYNKAQFTRNKRDKMRELDEKYGKVATGEDAVKKTDEMNEWLFENCHINKKGVLLKDSPNDKYLSKEYANMTANQRKLYDEYLTLKNDIDDLYGSRTMMMPQKRKSTTQRIIDSDSAENVLKNVKNALKEDLVAMEDDVDMFGDGTNLGLTDYTGNEMLKVPKVLRAKLKDPDELSEDIFGGLVEYGYCASLYNQLNSVVDQVELITEFMKDNHKIVKEKNGKPLFEKHKVGDTVEMTPVEAKETNLFAMIEDWKQSQLYLRYCKDEGNIAFNVSKRKATDMAIKCAAMAQLGCNWLANIQNAITGLCMNNIEAACGQYFTAKELASADKAYFKMLGGMVRQMYSQKKDNDIDLIMNYFNYKEDYDKTIKESKESGWRGLFGRFFGRGINFVGQEAGDSWLYNRVAIAHMKHKKVLTVDENGNETEHSLWDIIEKSFTVDEETGQRMLRLPPLFLKKDGLLVPFDHNRFGKQIAHINHGLYGIYNNEDRCAANRTCVGTMILYLRKWIKPQLNKRFMKKQRSVIMDEDEEGYYATVFRLFSELEKGKFALAVLTNKKDGISDTDWYNIKRARAEVLQTLVFAIISWWLLGMKDDYDDRDEDMPYILKFATYISTRTLHEIGALTPSTMMITEGFKTVSSPSAVIDPVKDMVSLLVDSVSDNWVEEDDRDKLLKRWSKAPVWGLSQLRQWDKFFNGLDTGIRFYKQ